MYRLNHPLAEAILAQARCRVLPLQELQFGYADYDGRISALKSFLGRAGWVAVSSFTVEALDQSEDSLLFAAVADDGEVLHEEAATRLFSLKARIAPATTDAVPAELEAITQRQRLERQRAITDRNAKFFEVEVSKLDGWADDLKLTLEREIKDMDRQIKEARRAAATALTLEEKLAGQKQIKALESLRTQKRRTLFDAQDEVDRRRESLIAQVEGKLTQNVTLERLFVIRWKLVRSITYQSKSPPRWPTNTASIRKMPRISMTRMIRPTANVTTTNEALDIQTLFASSGSWVPFYFRL